MSLSDLGFDISGRVALVTGSSRGIGKILATALGQAGATIVLNATNESKLIETAQELEALLGRPVHYRVFDVTDESSILDAVGSIENEIGPIEILVNNAGIQHREPLLAVSKENWERVIEVDLTSAFLVGRTVAAHMISRGHGKIVNISSVQADLARPTIGPYTAAKGGLRNLTRAMAAEWASSGIQINSVAPGYIQTEMTQALVDDPEFDAFIRRRTPAGRWGQTRDLGGPVVWLCSDASNFVNGQVIFVDGGMTVIV